MPPLIVSYLACFPPLTSLFNFIATYSTAQFWPVFAYPTHTMSWSNPINHQLSLGLFSVPQWSTDSVHHPTDSSVWCSEMSNNSCMAPKTNVHLCILLQSLTPYTILLPIHFPPATFISFPKYLPIDFLHPVCVLFFSISISTFISLWLLPPFTEISVEISC